MKKSLLACAVLMLGTNAALAQSNVTIYGLLDAAIVGESGGTSSITKVTSGASAASRIGFRGTEELGDGMAAFFTLETGARIDTGELDATNTIFNRQAFVGLKTRAGSVSLGRQYTPWHLALSQAIDPFATGYAGTAKNLFPDNGSNVRASNSVSYASPTMNGANVNLFYSAGEQSVISAGRVFGGSLNVANGPLALRLAYNARNTDVAATGVNHSLARNYLFGGNYNFKVVQVYAGFGIDKGFNGSSLWNTNNSYGGVKPTASTDSRDTLLGLRAPIGPGTLMFSVQHKDDRTSFNQDASEAGIGYQYNLSKRTGLYVAYGHIWNHNGAAYTVGNNSEAGTGSTAYNLGLRQTF